MQVVPVPSTQFVSRHVNIKPARCRSVSPRLVRSATRRRRRHGTPAPARLGRGPSRQRQADDEERDGGVELGGRVVERCGDDASVAELDLDPDHLTGERSRSAPPASSTAMKSSSVGTPSCSITRGNRTSSVSPSTETTRRGFGRGVVETVVRARVGQIGARRRLPMRKVVGVLTAAVGGRDLTTIAREAIERHQ